MIYLLDFRERDTGGAVVPGHLSHPESGASGPLAEDRLALEPRVTFLLHGFNVDRPGGREQLLRLAGKLEAEVEGALVATLWPGDHWSGPLSYSFEGDDADDTAAELAEFIDGIPGGAPVAFAAHSLGSRVAMETAKRLLGGAHPVTQICLLAAAIDDFSLASPDGYRRASQASERLAVLHSRKDTVLRWAYPAGDLFQSWIFFRRDEAGFALGLEGPKPHRPSSSPVPGKVFDRAIPKDREASHSDYLPERPPKALNSNQKSAARFTADVLTGRPDPAYP